MQKGDIILVSFPFTNLKGTKRRPAVLLFAGNMDVIVCFITSKFITTSEAHLTLDPQKKNGLKKTSTIRVDKIATLDRNLIKGKIGELKGNEISEMNTKLKQILGL